ncbi:MAG TPA: hypothetical protein VK399_00470, partial [Longimicrobiaceae bacterium]|nr:hypothetical protein [Longimicrobiaceae bacterium]
RLEVQQLDTPERPILELNRYRHTMAAYLAGLYPDRGAALDTLEHRFTDESLRHPTSPGDAVAAVLDRLSADPGELAAL